MEGQGGNGSGNGNGTCGATSDLHGEITHLIRRTPQHQDHLLQTRKKKILRGND